VSGFSFMHNAKHGFVVQLVGQGAISHSRLGTNIRTLPHFILIIIVALNSLQKFRELKLKRTIKVDSSDQIYVRKEKGGPYDGQLPSFSIYGGKVHTHGNVYLSGLG